MTRDGIFTSRDFATFLVSIGLVSLFLGFLRPLDIGVKRDNFENTLSTVLIRLRNSSQG
jgi:hypothetical protein